MLLFLLGTLAGVITTLAAAHAWRWRGRRIVDRAHDARTMKWLNIPRPANESGRLQILFVHELPALAEVYQRWVKPVGTMLPACDPERAVEILTEAPRIDLVIIQGRLLIQGGLRAPCTTKESAESLLDSVVCRNIPRLILSSLPQEEFQRTMLGSDFGFLAPVGPGESDVEKFLQTIGEAVAKGRGPLACPKDV